MLTFVLSFVDRQILNLMVGPIRSDMGLTDTDMGLLIGPAFVIIYSVLGLPMGWLSDRVVRKRLIATGVAFWSLATAACGFAETYAQLFVARMAVGVGEAVLAPAAASMIADSFAPQKRARALSVYSMGIYIGSGLAFTLGGLAIAFAMRAEGRVELPLLGSIQPWQQVFLMLGAIGLLFSPLLLSLREPQRPAQNRATPLQEAFVFCISRWRAMLTHSIGFGALSLTGYASSAWLPTYFVRVHAWPVGNFAMVYGVIIAVFCSAGILCGGAWADRWRRSGRRDAGLQVGRYAAFVGLAVGSLYALPMPDWLALTLLVPAAFLAGLPTGAGAAALQELLPSSMRGQGTALSVLILSLIGLGIGPAAVALCTDHLFGDVQAVGWSIFLVCSAGYLLAAWVLSAGQKHYRQALPPEN